MKYNTYLSDHAQRQATRRETRLAEDDHFDSSTEYRPCTVKCKESYRELDEVLDGKEPFEEVDIGPYCPEDRIARRNFISNLQLSQPIMLARFAYHGATGTQTFIWCLPTDMEPTEMNEKTDELLNKIKRQLPKYSTRAMRNDFINKYAKHVGAPRTLLKQMFYEIYGRQTNSET